MTIYKNDAYSNGEKLWAGRVEVIVTDIDGDRISYSEITGWSMGYPFVSGVCQSMTRARFVSKYPQLVEYVQAG